MKSTARPAPDFRPPPAALGLPTSELRPASLHSPLSTLCSRTPAALSAESWEFLLHRTILYAAGHVRRWRWRGSLGGVLPDGFDPNSLAAEAIAEFLQDPARRIELLHWTITEIQRDLERRVRRHINRLHHRSKNRLVRNEPALVPVTLDDGETISIIELIEDPNPQPDTVAIENESLVALDQLKLGFSAFLRNDRRLLRLFELYCQDRSKPEDVAASLRLPRRTVKNLRLRILRRWNQFHRGSFPANHPSDDQKSFLVLAS